MNAMLPFSGAKIALFMGDDLLVIKRDDKPDIPYPGHWDLPGGGREGDETPELCALREAREEAQLVLAQQVVLAGRGAGWHAWQPRLSGPWFRVYTNHDAVGVEIASAFKNVLAIAVGICDGLELGDNTRGAVMTRGVSEMARLGVALGGHHETFYGLAGIGDMITTCTSRHSRNRNYGEAVARGSEDPQALLDHAAQVVEGAVMTQAALKLCAKHSIELPITQEVHHVLFSAKNPKAAMRDLMERTLRCEGN